MQIMAKYTKKKRIALWKYGCESRERSCANSNLQSALANPAAIVKIKAIC